MRALVTGATGFIGSHLVTELRRLDWSVVCVCRRPVLRADAGVACIPGDLSSPETLAYTREAVGGVDVIFHLAACIPHPGFHPDLCGLVKANVLATASLLTSFLRLDAGVFVYASSLSVLGRPTQLPITEGHTTRPTRSYAVSKLAAELLCEQVRVGEARPIVSLRIASPYGPGMPETTVLPRFIRLALASRDLPLLGTGARSQNFVHVGDVVRACVLASRGSAAGVFNIGGSQSISMRDLGHYIVGHVPRCGSRVMESGTPDPQEEYRWEVDLSSSRQRLHYEPHVSLAEGLKDYIDCLQSGRRMERWWREPDLPSVPTHHETSGTA